MMQLRFLGDAMWVRRAAGKPVLGVALAAFLLWCLIVLQVVHGQEMTAKISGVSDGDRLAILHDSKTEHVNLYGVACPRKGQPFGMLRNRQRRTWSLAGLLKWKLGARTFVAGVLES